MEPSSAESIAALMKTRVRGALARARVSLDASGIMPRQDRIRRCQCGGCRQCVGSARWERIFLEKFADPDYYARRGVQHSSPLASL
jgi:hypothetical protein